MKVQRSKRIVRTLQAIHLALAILALPACKQPTFSKRPAQSALDESKTRELGNSVATDLLTNNVSDLYPKLERDFRDSVTEKELSMIIEQMVQAYGKPLDFEFKQQESSSRVNAQGISQPMQKLWYATKTTMYEKGSHFLIIEIVSEGDKLFVSSFALVNFPLGVPANLK